jgi:hypothetical protein
VTSMGGPDATGASTFRPIRALTRPRLKPPVFGARLFAAVAALQLAERNLVDIEAPVTRYVPEVSPLERIRVVHLLSHRSGLADTLRGFLAVYFPGERPPSTAEALSAYRIKAGGMPGRGVQYRNVNYVLLGGVIARVSGTAYRARRRRQRPQPRVDGADAGHGRGMNAMRMPRTMKAAHAICEVLVGAEAP